MALNDIELIINGIFSLIFVVISLIVGIIIALNYRFQKNKNFLYVGGTWIFLTSGWWGSSISFILALFTSTNGLPIEYYLLVNFVPLPIAILLWLMAFTNFLYKEKQKVMLLTVVFLIAIFEAYLLFFIFTDPTQIAQKISAVDAKNNNPILGIFLGAILLTFLLTGLVFAKETRKSEEKETRLKGTFLMVAFPSLAIGALLDAGLDLNIAFLTMVRILLISSAFEFYLGFIMPSFIKNRLK